MDLKVGIICAGDSELEPFIQSINKCIITSKAMLKFYEGIIDGVNIVALFSGVCKVNAAIATQILIDTYKVDVIINSGTAGGLSDNIKLFDTVISTETAYYDVDEDILTEFHPWMKSIYFEADDLLINLSKRAVLNMKLINNIYWGRIITGEKFIEDEKREELNSKYSPLCVDMETASIAHVCYVNSIPFISIRTITDTAEHSGIDFFEQNCEKASDISKDVVLGLLREIKNEKSKD